jgi:hypothetical protein
MSPKVLFWALFLFRYLRLLVHIIAYKLYRPTPVPAKPKYGRSNVTAIIPTVEPQNPDFDECIRSVLKNGPKKILVVTVGEKNFKLTEKICKKIWEQFKSSNPDSETTIKVTKTSEANKRRQLGAVIPEVDTEITAWVDDHVFLPTENFLPAAIAPFDDDKVGIVGTNKRVRRFNHGYSCKGFWNFVGCLYLERHNFEITATTCIDGGAFVISGRTSLHRTSIIKDTKFLDGFQNEICFFGLLGPINPDDDNFVTRWNVTNGYKIAFQNCEDATIETTLGTYPKFLSQCMRWARTTWRSNSCSLFTDRTVWTAQPWCVYAVFITSFFNFALFTDAALVYLLYASKWASATNLALLALWMVASKLVKIVPHFKRHPGDLLYLPGQILFGYYHSLIKLWALFTFWDITWGTRDLAHIEVDGSDSVDREEAIGLLNDGGDDGSVDD